MLVQSLAPASCTRFLKRMLWSSVHFWGCEEGLLIPAIGDERTWWCWCATVPTPLATPTTSIPEPSMVMAVVAVDDNVLFIICAGICDYRRRA